MEFIKDILDEILVSYNIISVEEDFKFLKMKIEVNTIIPSEIDIDNINKVIENKLDKDILKLFLIQEFEEDGEDILYTYSNGNNMAKFLDEIKSEILEDNLEENDRYVLEINIDKNSKNEYISVYSINSMIEYLSKSNLKILLYEFSEVINRNKVCIFNIKDNLEQDIYTNSIYFTSNIDRLNANIDISSIHSYRNEEIKSRIGICNFNEEKKYPLIASDFNIISQSNMDDIKIVFDKLKIALSIISICDISTILDNEINIILNGYKKIENSLKFDEILNKNTLSYYDTYKWIYSEGEISDKIGIARNIISISYKDDSILNVDKSIYESILSSYAIYLKENVERYIEVKEKLNDVLFDLSKRLSDTVTDVGKDFRNNIFALLTFFITVLLTNSASSGNIEKIFTEDITKLVLYFILGSILYMVFSIIESLSFKKKIKKEIERVKKIYTDILNESDISNIVEKYDFKVDLKYMNSRICFYVIFWIIFLIVIYICTISLSGLSMKDTLHLLL